MKTLALLQFMFKMGLAGSVMTAVAFAYDFSYLQWLWMVIAAFVVMDYTLGASLVSSIERALGTIVGGLLGALLALVLPSDTFLSAIVAIFVIGFLGGYFTHYYNSLKLFSVTAAIVFVVSGHHDQSTWMIAKHRIAENLLAIAICTLISLCVFPCRIKRQFQAQVGSAYQSLATMIPAIAQRYCGTHFQIESVIAETQRMNDYAEAIRSSRSLFTVESFFFIQKKEKLLLHLADNVEGLNQVVKTLLEMDVTTPNTIVQRYFSTVLQPIFDEVSELMRNIAAYCLGDTSTLSLSGDTLAQHMAELSRTLDTFRASKVSLDYDKEGIMTCYALIIQVRLIVNRLLRLTSANQAD